jgi:hypothetical protein
MKSNEGNDLKKKQSQLQKPVKRKYKFFEKRKSAR